MKKRKGYVLVDLVLGMAFLAIFMTMYTYSLHDKNRAEMRVIYEETIENVVKKIEEAREREGIVYVRNFSRSPYGDYYTLLIGSHYYYFAVPSQGYYSEIQLRDFKNIRCADNSIGFYVRATQPTAIQGTGAGTMIYDSCRFNKPAFY